MLQFTGFLDRMDRMKLPDAPTFLITRLSAIGDCILTLPIAVALKSRWPNCRIIWCVDCAAQQILKVHPAVDSTIRLKKGFLKRPKEVWGLRKQFRDEKIDVAIDPQGLFKSSVLAWLSGAPVRIGFDASQAREKAWWLYTHRVTATESHLVDKQLQLLKPLTDEATSKRADEIWGQPSFGLSAPDEAKAFAAKTLVDLGFQSGEFVLVNVGAGWPSKLWPANRFAEVIRRLGSNSGLRSLVVWAGEAEKKVAEEICGATSEYSAIAPSTSLLELTALIESARLVITSDTGPLHMASAVRTPILALFGPTDPNHCGPYELDRHLPNKKALHLVVQKWDLASDTSITKAMRKDDDRAMRAIEVDDVMQCLDAMLQ